MDQEVTVRTDLKTVTPHVEPYPRRFDGWLMKWQPPESGGQKRTSFHAVTVHAITVTVTIHHVHVRAAVSSDKEAIRLIQTESPEAAQWDPSDYSVLVAEFQGDLVGFLAWRSIAPDEIEILNLAVARTFRRQGVARALLSALPGSNAFLEVRESNQRARALYRNAGFIEAGIRFGYYSHPAESGIVMRRDL